MDNTNQKPEEKDISEKEEKKTRKADKKAERKEKKQAKAEKKAKRKKLSKEDKKGVLLITALLLVAIVLFNVCVKAGKKDDISATVSTVTTETTTQPITQTPTAETTATTTQTSETTAVTSTQAATEKQETTKATETTKTTESPQPTVLTDAEILDAVTKGVNSLKSETASFKGSRVQNINVWVNTCSVPALTGTINKVIEAFTGENVSEFEFVNGKGTDPKDGNEVTTSNVFPPTDKPFSLTLEGVASASVSQNDKGTVYSVKVVPETSTLENPRPPHHNSAGDTFNLAAVNIPIGEITKADFEYPGAVVSVTVDDSGKVVEYYEKLEIKGTGEGKLLAITGTAELEGYMDEMWTIEWK